MRFNKILIVFSVILLFVLVGCSKDVPISEDETPAIMEQPAWPNLKCETVCTQHGVDHSRCGSSPVIPEADPICYANETDVGDTEDCTIYTEEGPLVGVMKSCCC